MKRAKTGDIIELKTSRGLAYLQYTHEHIRPPQFGSLIRALEGFYLERPQDLEALARTGTRFRTFFPLKQAVNRGYMETIGNATIPPKYTPFPIFRNGTPDPETKKVSNWWLWDGEREWRVGALNEEQMEYPILEIWNDTLLMERIESDWTPRDTEW